jgi:signal transduction histidine kinase
MERVAALARRFGLDALVVVAAAAAVIEVVLRDDPARAPEAATAPAASLVALAVLVLLGRHRFPFAAPVAVWVIAAAASFIDGRLMVFSVATYAAGIAAAFLLGNLRDLVRAGIGLAVVIAGSAIVVYNSPENDSGELVSVPFLFGIAWLAGAALRARGAQAQAAEERAAQAERERESAARVAVAEERARIARELHDIVAHAVSVMVLQVGAVRHRLPADLVDDEEALRGVEQAGRGALAEMRRLLGALHDDGGDVAELAPRPGLDDLPSLAQVIGRAGLPVRLHTEGDAVSLPPAIDLSAFRIVQEGLTNALKHSGASRADVTVRYGPADVRLRVRDDGPGAAPGDGHGHGLVGIHERVKIYGGEMAAGPAPDGGFVLDARLPLDARRP